MQIKSSGISNSSTMPGPPGGILLGHYPRFLRDKLGFFSQCAADYGPVVKLKLRRPTFLLTHPKDIKHVLVTNPGNYEKTPRLSGRRAKRALGEGLLSQSSGAGHLRQRRMLLPAFHRKSMEVFADVIAHSARDAIAGWRSGQVIDIASEMKNLARWVMLRVLFGNNSRDLAAPFLKAVAARRQYYEHMVGSLFPFPEYWPGRAVRDYPKAFRQLNDTIAHAIQARRRAPGPSDDMMSAFVHARYEDGTGMTDAQIRHEALTFIDTGYETTAAALAWTLYLISQHGQAESQILAELHENPSSAQDFSKLIYTGKVLAESMRLYPPSWMFARKARNKDSLPSGTVLPAGAKMFLCQYVAHRHPQYFPNPERFDPERFDELQSANRPRFAYFPFGAGPHACVGESFARMEIMMVLGIILRRFRLELESGQNIVPDPGLALRPKYGIRMRLADRQD